MPLEGTLHDMSLDDLFGIFEAGSRSGHLTMIHNSERCQMLISRGWIAEAMLYDSKERQITAVDAEAVLHVCGWENASFTFEHDADLADRTKRIAASFQQLQSEARRRNALNAMPLGLGDMIQMEQNPGGDLQRIELSLDEWQLLSSLCLPNSLGEACLRAGMAPNRGLEAARSLYERGLLHSPHDEAALRTTAALAVQLPPSTRHAPVNTRQSDLPTPIRPTATVEHRPKAPVNRPNGSLLKAIIRRVQSL